MDGSDIPPSPGTASRTWILILCSAVAIAGALVLCTGLLARQLSTWLVIGAGAAVFPLLPLLWHGLAEAKRSDRGTVPSASTIRFSLRSLAIALVVLGVSMGDLGPQRIVQNLSDFVGRIRSTPKTAGSTAPRVASSQPVTPQGLEIFIPTDATLAVGLAGSAAMEQLLAVFGVDTREKLAALATCKIDLESARVLIAVRGKDQMIVVRAPGISDERNLYCMVGVMGSNRLQIHPEMAGPSKRFLVKGFLSQALNFQVLDASTVMALDEGWQATADKKVFSVGSNTAEGRLAAALVRLDRSATLWAASVFEVAPGTWDMAIDARQEGNLFRLKGSSVPSSGQGDRAELSLQVPLAFASALSAGALAQGLRGVASAVMTAGVLLAPPASLVPALPKSATPPGGVPSPGVAPAP